MAKLKGMMFTLVMLLIALALLSYTVVIFSTTKYQSNRVGEIGSVDKIYEKEESIQSSIQTLFNTTSNILISQKNLDEISFNISLPYNATEFISFLDIFRRFIELNDRDIKLNNSMDYFPLLINPNNIEYYIESNKTIHILPIDILRIKRYKVTIHNYPDSGATCQIHSQPTGYLPMTINVYAKAMSGYVEICNNLMLIDPRFPQHITTTNNKTVIFFDNPGEMRLNYNFQNYNEAINVTTTIFLNRTKDDPQSSYVTIPKINLLIQNPVLSLYKITNARIY